MRRCVRYRFVTPSAAAHMMLGATADHEYINMTLHAQTTNPVTIADGFVTLQSASGPGGGGPYFYAQALQRTPAEPVTFTAGFDGRACLRLDAHDHCLEISAASSASLDFSASPVTSWASFRLAGMNSCRTSHSAHSPI